MRGTLLLVDDEDYVRESLARVFARRDFVVRTAAGAAEALRAEAFEGADAAIVDLRMPDGDGLAVLRALQEREPLLPVIILTGHGSVVNAVECLKAGAFDFVQKPADPEELVLLVDRAMADASRRRELGYLRDREPGAAGGGSTGRTSGGRPVLRDTEPSREPEPIGTSPAWKEVMRLARTAAPADASVLLLGESGVGKEVVARYIHRSSRRAERPFVAVNCATIPTELFESEFFGHRKGSFTGAHSDREGRFRVAHEGTLFLDEIGCMPESSQTKVLRVLGDGVFERIGETRPTTVDVRIIAATNAPVETLIRDGGFREDLYYRIAVVVIAIPPLRERPEDIEVLANHFLAEVSSRQGKVIRSVQAEALDAMQAYSWPGNVRELRNVIERAVLFETGDHLRAESLPSNIGAAAIAGSRRPSNETRAAGEGTTEDPGVASGRETLLWDVGRLPDLQLRETLLRVERELIEEALRRANGVRREAARTLSVDERNLSYFLRKHGLGRSSGEES